MREPSYHPVHAYKETGAARLGRIRRQGAGRMREMRQRWRDVGRPDPATLDRAVVDALRDLLLREPEGYRLATFVDPQALVLETARHLVERSERAREAGRDVVVYRREEVAAALQARLLQPPKAGVTA